jgi:hypothetical protein
VKGREFKLVSHSSLTVRVLVFALGFTLLEIGLRFLHGGQHAIADVAWSFVGGIFIAVVFAWSLPKTQLKRLDLVVLSWVILYVVQLFSNELELYFFSANPPSVSVFVGSVISSLLPSLVEGVMAGVLFLPDTHDKGLVHELSNYFNERSTASWVGRILVGSIAYFPIYFFFGALIGPFVIPYYTNPSLGLTIPPFTLIIPLELFRGFLYTILLLPVFAATKTSKRTAFVIVASTLYVLGALVPLMVSRSLPSGVVPFHLVEILADFVVYGAVLTSLLGRKAK